MILIDGSAGEGGGQILRTALSLALVTGKPFRIERIRAARSRPGLLRQHLTAVNAASEVGAAEVRGAELGSTELTFAPGRVRPGDYTFAVGTAGSTSLILQTLLPALMLASGPSTLALEGGTHNPLAPPWDFLARSFLPLVGRTGPRITTEIERHGFYPAGGGRAVYRIEPAANLARLDLVERGEIRARRARALVANLPSHIARRELDIVARRLSWKEEWMETEEIAGSRGPGNVIILEIESEQVTEVITGFGERGVAAEAVASAAVDEARDYLTAGAAVGAHLADQILIPLALAGGGSFTTVSPSRHTTTNIEVIRKFLDLEITATKMASGRWRIDVG